ncbi:FAD-binding domain-containing protein [Coprinellus micaceus]|uniref:FAD-binding domain-containing protein n=1 Tax=Coprinellus micaceus TaxID=71717 RepID=A0A4Y7SPA4_COPMI|nr:FAD-binding domain-containing protein [Coprinellus micaceus]
MSDSFTASVQGDVIDPNHPDYASSLERWAKNAERKAKVVVFVKDAEDVVKALSYAKENSLLIAIRGGGHNSAAASSAEGGLVIDLSKYLNRVRVDEENKLAYVGGGALWRDVDTETIKYGLATVGGTVNHTGVGGLTLGGGYGWLTGRHGLTIDNLKQVTIVTADGTILTASTTENTDLFWAIRGGGSNFGVVTEFVFALHPQRKAVFAGMVVFTHDKFEALIDLTKTWYENIKEDEAMLQTAVLSPEGHPVLAVTLFYNGSEDKGRANFKNILDLGPVVDLAREIPYEQLNGLTVGVIIIFDFSDLRQNLNPERKRQTRGLLLLSIGASMTHCKWGEFNVRLKVWTIYSREQ